VELAHDGSINWPQTERWIKLTQRCQGGAEKGPFTIKNCNDLKGSLENASKLLTLVICVRLVWLLTDVFFSLNAMLSSVSIRAKNTHTRLGVVHCGAGSSTTSSTQRSYGISSGTHGRFLCLMENVTHESTPSRGPGTVSGTSR
jgi:hypothetical protein